jgi:hypothetical protein
VTAEESSREPAERKYYDRPCYVFNERLKGQLDDTGCSHCRFYLTTKCPSLGEFLEKMDELEPLE